MNEEIKELTIIAELIDSGKIIDRIDKTFFLLNSEEQNEAAPKGLDETLTEFLQELETKVAEKNFRIRNKDDFCNGAIMSLILFFAKPNGISAKLKVPVEPIEKTDQEEERNGESSDSE